MATGKILMESPDGMEQEFVDSTEVNGLKSLGFREAKRAKPSPPRTMMGRPTASTIGKSWLDQLPMAGSIAGGIGGGVAAAPAAPFLGPAAPAALIAGRIAGGSLGKGIGQGARELGYRALGEDAPGDVGSAMQEGLAEGGIGEALGGTMKGLGWVATRTGVSGRGKEVVQAVNNMIKERLPAGGIDLGLPEAVRKIPIIGPALVRGSKAAEAIRLDKKSIRDAFNRAAQARGETIDRTVADDAVERLIDLAKNAPEGDKEIRYLQGRLQYILSKPRELTPTRAEAMRSAFDRRSRAYYKALEAGTADPAMTTKAEYMKSVADALRGALHELEGNQASNKALGSAISARNAIFKAESHPSIPKMIGRGTIGASIGAGAGALAGDDPYRGAALGSAIGGLATGSPAAVTRLGMFMTDPTLLALLRNSPRFLNIQSRGVDE